MKSTDSRGLTALATLLDALASGTTVRAASFAEEHDFARSSVFDLTRRLEAAGLVTRSGSGDLHAGPAALDFAWSTYGLQGMRGPTEAVLLWLNDLFDAPVEATCSGDLLLCAPGRSPMVGPVAQEMSEPICDQNGTERMRLSLQPTAAVDADLASMAMKRAIATLEHHLMTSC
ncbi:hypothetical protein [Aerobium aerolatum]|uniref:Uncharacterized protein n=1 Tax=Aquamicrobium aerolatum DSM 21857 TaxID=1121003 RepID=A0A1I3R520_9HYPH|nr:hypothetical protein [Aquamicrobium aerolatum]SFJ41694.1 hypothetical protein SAMN03080618_02896 [Aquamicrobium aerolatum DSM 21857]